ncbi:zinc finger MYM-type protein 1-like [Melanaphis sacchari]|uniref:zinc finger MYM-type protein 1-like n=1 Tax=Melanaphis sacchari TaxID=742174 RepID=UPI000DC150CF|nr:zinc finger MYM-type protein 1-like [Melanaphis sacchari]
MVRTNILKQVNKSGQFAVIIDTTTDVSNQEQFTVILRYIDEGKPQERLVALETAADSTGLGMFKMFCSITEKHNIKWKTQMIAQTYDCAASMQGKYSGLKTRIQVENPRAMFTWCFAHKLNLVIVDTCDCCINTKTFFGDVGALIEFMRARKRTAACVECQKILNPKEQKRRIKRFSNTRWISHDRALVVIQEKYPALLKALENISKANDSDRDTTSMAKNLISVITSFQFVLVLVLMRKIFSISTEVSNYLQSKSIDFMQAIKMVNVAKNRLKMVRTDEGCTEIINTAKEFATKNNLLQCDFKVIRARKKKIMPGELSRDEVLCSPADLFRCDVCFKVLDAIITSIDIRFNDSQEILKDLSLLTSERMLSIKTKKQLPDNAFQQLSNWININTTKLQCEYLTFSNSLNDLFNDTNPTYTSKPVNKESEGTDQPPDISSEISDESEIEEASTANMSCLDILGLLSRHNLIAAFPNLYLAYKALCIIPASSASAERSFSKVKIVKTRLRSSIGQNRLESLLILSSEKDIEIDRDEAINIFANSSDLLMQNLLFK